MKIEVGNYVRVQSNSELHLAVSMFYAAGYDYHYRSHVESYAAKNFFEKEPCLFIKDDGSLVLLFYKYLVKKFPRAVEIFLPRPKALLNSIEY